MANKITKVNQMGENFTKIKVEKKVEKIKETINCTLPKKQKGLLIDLYG